MIIVECTPKAYFNHKRLYMKGLSHGCLMVLNPKEQYLQ